MNTNEWPKITVDTTLDELKEIHERIWDYAIEHMQKPDTPYFSDCAFCEYMRQLDSQAMPDCGRCPLTRVCFGFFSLYQNWTLAARDALLFMTDEKIAAAEKAATAIRDLDF